MQELRHLIKLHFYDGQPSSNRDGESISQLDLIESFDVHQIITQATKIYMKYNEQTTMFCNKDQPKIQ